MNFFLLLIFLVFNMTVVQADHAWPQSEMPHTYIMDSSFIPFGLPNNESSKIKMKDAILEWNSNISLGPLINIQLADISGPSYRYKLIRDRH